MEMGLDLSLGDRYSPVRETQVDDIVVSPSDEFEVVAIGLSEDEVELVRVNTNSRGVAQGITVDKSTLENWEKIY